MCERPVAESSPAAAPEDAPAGCRRYRVLGLTLETDATFQTPLPTTSAAPDLRFQVLEGSRPRDWREPATPVFTSPVRIDGDQPLFTIHQGPRGDLLRFTEVAEFSLSDREIHACLLDPDYAFMMEIYLLGIVLSYWLERQGIPVLHASAVSVVGRAVGFVGTNQGGKSSLAIALMNGGHPLLADDLVGVQRSSTGIEARPGFPSMRMWPDLARYAVGDAWEALPLAHPRFEKRRVAIGPGGFGRFRDRVQPLACLYLPQRCDPGGGEPEVRVEAVSPQEAIFQLLRGSFLPRVTLATGFAPERLEIFSTLVERVPVRRLIYPRGFEHLPRVAECIVRDLEGLRPAAEGGRR